MKICFFCEATESPLWRKDEETGSTLCNACGLFVKRAKKRKSTESPPRKRARDQIRQQQQQEEVQFQQETKVTTDPIGQTPPSPASSLYNLESLAQVATSHEERTKFSFTRIEQAVLYHLKGIEEPNGASNGSNDCSPTTHPQKPHVKCGSVVEYQRSQGTSTSQSGQQSPMDVKYAIIQHLFRDKTGKTFFFPIPLQLIEGHSCCNGLSDLKVDAPFKDLYREETVIVPSRLILVRAISKIILP